MERKDWQWDEMRQIGTDYTDLAEIAAYDGRMAQIRDVDAEARDMLTLLNLPPGAALLDIGCGTGRFIRAAAKAGLTVAAVDVSARMLEYVRAKAAEEGIHELTTQHAGFLTLAFPPAHFDAIVSGAALHHLPDVWKAVALHNVASLLKPGGQFILRDVVFTQRQDEPPHACITRFVDSFSAMHQEAARHAAQEFSTYDWIMEGLLKRAGFTIRSTSTPSESFIVYHCQKT